MRIQAVFTYSSDELDRLEKSISAERLQPYQFLANGDQRLAIKLYEWNTAISESFYSVLQALEISLRNSIHESLRTAYRRPDWYHAAPLRREQAETIQAVEARLLRSNKTITAGRVIAEIHLGFWVSLLGPAYAQLFWDKHLHKAMSVRLGRKAVYARLQGIRKLRNRVAHYESILGRNLKDDYSQILETIHWICPTTALWVRTTSNFHQRYASRPTS